MIPEVAAVVAAAREFVAGTLDGSDGKLAALEVAVDALDMRTTRPGTTYEEQDRAWGEVVEGDEILSAKTGKWYAVDRVVTDEAKGTIRVWVTVNPTKPITRPVADPVRLKRGVSGDAVDLFQILWSGPRAERAKPKDVTGAGPIITEEEESDG